MYYAEKTECFVLASLGTPTKYVHVLGNEKYKLATRLSGATKIVDRETAASLLNYYRSSTSDTQEFAIIPMVVTYELIDERELKDV